MKIITSELASLIRKKRADLKLKQIELAKRIGISRQTLSRVENDENIIVQDRIYNSLTIWLKEEQR